MPRAWCVLVCCFAGCPPEAWRASLHQPKPGDQGAGCTRAPRWAVEAAEESGLVAYYAVMSELVDRLGLTEPVALIEEIERQKPFRLNGVVQGVSKNDNVELESPVSLTPKR